MSNDQTVKNIEEASAAEPVEMPASFAPFGIRLPPMFLEMAGAENAARFVGINYFGSKATWHDGRAAATFSYYSVYEPFVNHPAILFQRRDADLGSDDTQATHSIVIDRVSGEMYLAPYDEACRFLKAQHPPAQPLQLSAEDLRQLAARVEAERTNTDLRTMQRRGMFELFAPAAEDRSGETAALVEWMNEHTPEAAREFFAKFNFVF